MKTTLVSPHINQPCPPKLRKGGLHDIERASFVSSSPNGTLMSSLDKRTRQAQQDELLRLASSNVRICNASMKGAPYTCPELQRNAGIPEARFQAFTLPSRVGGRLHYPGGRVEMVA